MYILVDHIGQAIHPLGEKPLEAVLEFCKYVKDCMTDSLYPRGCANAAFEAFRWHVTDGTASELFDMVQTTSYRIRRDKRTFEVAVVPRPACWECEHWKGDGAFCERGEREQSSQEPGCRAWFAPHTEWKDVRRARVSTPRNIKPLTEFDRETSRA